MGSLIFFLIISLDERGKAHNTAFHYTVKGKMGDLTDMKIWFFTNKRSIKMICFKESPPLPNWKAHAFMKVFIFTWSESGLQIRTRAKPEQFFTFPT